MRPKPENIACCGIGVIAGPIFPETGDRASLATVYISMNPCAIDSGIIEVQGGKEMLKPVWDNVVSLICMTTSWRS
jgi:hypothetical protein